MADINRRVPGCDDDCDGERGPRGHRGHRGPRGHHGHDGATGFTGPAGTSSDQGLAAYGYAVNFGQQVVTVNQAVIFSLGGLVFPNSGITPPAPGGAAFTILSTGDYEYIFYAVGQHDQAPTFTMQFAIFVNGVNQGIGHEFNSNLGDNANDVQLIRGQGIIHLLAGDMVTLVNRTANGTINVQLISSVESNNATLSLKKLSS